MARRLCLISLTAAILLLTLGAASAQRGGDRPGRGGATRTPLFDGSNLTVTPMAERPDRNIQATPFPTLSQLEPGTLPTLQRPVIPTLSVTLPVGQLTLEAPASAEAEMTITSFAGQHLGLSVDVLYAGDFSSAEGSSADSTMATLDLIMSQLPAQAQAFLKAASAGSGAAYWGLWQTGAATVTVGYCIDNPGCTVSADNLAIAIGESSAGVYSVYAASAPTDISAALSLITSVYPGLAGLDWQPYAAQQGYAFYSMAVAGNGRGQNTIKLVYAGVVDSNGQAAVYSLVAVGEGYVQMALQ